MRLALVALAVALAGCPNKEITSSGITTNPGNGRPDDNPRRDLIHDLEATVLENYQQLTSGNITAYADGIARDHEVMFIGLGRGDLIRGKYEDIRDKLLCDWRPFATAQPTVLSKNLRVDTSRKKSVGWISDEMSYRVTHDGREATIPIRFTALFVRDIDRWVLVLQHMSFASSVERLERSAGRRAPRALPDLGRPGVKAGAERNVLRIVQNLLAGRKGNGRPDSRGDYRKRKIGHSEHDLVLWPSPKHEYRGPDAHKSPRLQSIYGQDGRVEISDYKVTVSPDGDTAWVVANLVNETKVNEKQVQIQLRATFVLTIREFGWTVVQAHVSSPISTTAMSRLLLGAPAPNAGPALYQNATGLKPCKRERRRRGNRRRPNRGR